MKSRIIHLFYKIQALFSRLTEPSNSIQDIRQRQQIRLINSIVVVFVPVAFLTGLGHVILTPSKSDLIYDSAMLMLSLSTILLLFAAFFGRFVGYRGATALVFITGYLLIMINASFDQPDYFDMVYIVLLTVLASAMFRTTMVTGVALILTLSVALLLQYKQVSAELFWNIFAFIIVSNLILIFTTHYRQLIESDRLLQMHESESLMKLITSQLPVSVWITDKKLSRRVSFGYIQDVEDVATIPNPKSLNAYRRALDGDSAQFEDHKHDRYLQYRVEPMRDESGDIIGTLSVASDITEQKVIQQQALQLELERNRVEILSKFIEHSSHDLRTPLSNINTYLYLLDNSVETEKQHNYIQIIREQSERLQGLINNMLMLQRLELEPDFEFSSMSLKSLLDGLETAYRPRIEGKQITFAYTPPDGGIAVNVTEKYLFAALTRILDNAIQFTSEGGTINLYVTHGVGDVTIGIQDTGIGITEAQLPHIFDLFYRGDDSRPTVTGDNGLGLTIARRIITAHQGQITVESRVDHGTTVNVTLPMLPIQQHV